MQEQNRTEQMMNLSADERRMMGKQTSVLALVIVRSAVDMMLIKDLDDIEASESGRDKLFAKTFAPLVKAFESDAQQEAFYRAMDIFSKEEIEPRMQTMESILQLVYQGLIKLGANVEAGKEFIDERENNDSETR